MLNLKQMIQIEAKSEHYLENDIFINIDDDLGTVEITSFVKNTGHRRFERVKLNKEQSLLLTESLVKFLPKK